MTENYFKPARRQKLPLKFGLFGPSKSGKTFTMLKLMRGIVGPDGKFAVIDSENRGSEEYQGDPEVGDFDIAPLHTNFAADRFVRILQDVQGFGYDGVCVDGITPLWDGPGGVQAVADANNSGNKKFGGWDVANAEHQKIIRAIVEFPTHLICTMRSKTAYVIGEDGKTRKVGLKPVQRDGIEYEFRLLGEMDADNNMKISGRRNFQNRIVAMPGHELAKELLQYLGSEEAVKDDADALRAAQDAMAEGATTQVEQPAATEAPEATNVVSMWNPAGVEVGVPAVSVASLLAAGWSATPPNPTPTSSPAPAAPSAEPAPTTPEASPPATPEPAATPTPAEAPTTTAPLSTNATTPSGEKMEASQLQRIVELCQELAVVKPDKGDASWWMEWANQKATEEYHQDFGSLTRDNTAGLIERIEKTKLALKDAP